MGRLGSVLAELHDLSVASVPAAILPFPSLDPVDAKAWIQGSPAARLLIREIQARPWLSVAYQSALRDPGPQTLIHGDLNRMNILCDAHTPVFIDWECCGLGSPGWDLGSILGDLLIGASGTWAKPFKADFHAPAQTSAVPLQDLQRAARRFIMSYARHSCGTAPDPAYVARFTAAAIVGKTYAQAMQSYRPTDGASFRLLIAEAVARFPAQLFGDDPWT